MAWPIERGLRAAWRRIPDPTRRWALEPGQRLYGSLRALRDVMPGGRALAGALVEGAVRGDPNAPLRMALVAEPAALKNMADRFIEGATTAVEIRDVGLLVARRWWGVQLATVDVGVFIVPRVAVPLFTSGPAGGRTTFGRMPGASSSRTLRAVFPESVETVLDLHVATAKIAEAAQPLGTYVRKVARKGYSPAVDRGQGALDRFYDRYYVPYMARRFGVGAATKPRSFYQRFIDQLEVLWASVAGQRVAGVVLIHHEDRCRFQDVGYLDGEPGWLGEGAGHALYLYAIRHARARGHHALDLGPMRPFLEDSLLHYRAAWGATLCPNRWATGRLGIVVPNPHAGLFGLLRRAPLVREEDGELIGVTASGPGDGTAEGCHAASARLRARYGHLGVRSFEYLDEATT